MNDLMKRMIVAYRAENPGHRFSLTAVGSGEGISALVSGRADIAMLSRVMSVRELALCREAKVEPERFIVALDGLVPIVHESNPVAGLTISQLRAIYSGEIANWQLVGGPDLRIVVFGRASGSGSRDIWIQKVMGGLSNTSSGVNQMASNKLMASTVREHPGGIGYVGLGYVDRKVRALSVDGRSASAETIISGTYPISRTLNLYLDKDAPAYLLQFVNFVLGPTGRKIIESEGFVPVP